MAHTGLVAIHGNATAQTQETSNSEWSAISAGVWKPTHELSRSNPIRSRLLIDICIVFYSVEEVKRGSIQLRTCVHALCLLVGFSCVCAGFCIFCLSRSFISFIFTTDCHTIFRLLHDLTHRRVLQPSPRGTLRRGLTCVNFRHHNALCALQCSRRRR